MLAEAAKTYERLGDKKSLQNCRNMMMKFTTNSQPSGPIPVHQFHLKLGVDSEKNVLLSVNNELYVDDSQINNMYTSKKLVTFIQCNSLQK